MSESWTWSYVDSLGEQIPDAGAAGPFPTQAEAEAYLSESWAELAQAGVATVTLLRDGEVEYGPMSLAAE